MAIQFEIDIGAGPRIITIDPEEITLGFLEDIEEAQVSNKWRPVRTAIGSLLHLSDTESRAITVRQFRQIGAALQSSVAEQATIPNGRMS